MTEHKASCLCGAVQVHVTGDLPEAVACHCTICRKHTGHFEASVDLPRDRVTIDGAEHITWFQSSAKVRRGFCGTCGSSLFFDPPHLDWIGVSLGAFDGPTGTKLVKHIFVADKGDYYDIADGLPQDMAPPES
ncbi:GFA family protein [Cognatishimia sp. MH4019]|uniref:GFA family protein n=1 Tax=Cognatishimia sp. MH4019 TaxID=2854030 RepID=UPI001CD75175|nr:GFA family protein [Cognatishimia sp. MH4019]